MIVILTSKGTAEFGGSRTPTILVPVASLKVPEVTIGPVAYGKVLWVERLGSVFDAAERESDHQGVNFIGGLSPLV